MTGRLPASLVAPTRLSSTLDAPTCSAHGGLGGGLACTALLPKGRLALVWDWPAQGGNVEGFLVYRFDGNAHDLVGRQASGSATTMYIVDPVPKGGYAGTCYAVAAYDRGGERPLSETYCVPGGATIQSISLTPIEQLTVSKSLPDPPYPADISMLSVGYFHNTQKAPAGDTAWNKVWRGALLFDLSAVSSPEQRREIRTARLKLTVISSWLGGSLPLTGAGDDGHTSCVATIGVGVDRWWQRRGWMESVDAIHLGVYTGPDVSYDVTALVSRWASGSPNFGFVLQGADENLDAFTESACTTRYRNEDTRLEIEYR